MVVIGTIAADEWPPVCVCCCGPQAQSCTVANARPASAIEKDTRVLNGAKGQSLTAAYAPQNVQLFMSWREYDLVDTGLVWIAAAAQIPAFTRPVAVAVQP